MAKGSDRDDTPPAKRSKTSRFFLRGLGVILPSVLTLWLLVAAFRFIDSNIAGPINAGLRLGVSAIAEAAPLQQFLPTDEELAAEQSRAARLRLSESEDSSRWRLVRTNVESWWEARWYLDLTGLALAMVAIYFLGRLVGGYLGRRLLALFESGLVALPGIRQVYPALKQIVEFLFGGGQKKMSFNRVVLVEYPRPGIWSMGLVTGDAAGPVAKAVGESVTVFMPSSPTPFTGWTVTVPKSDVRELDMTIDEALRYLVSAGVVVPDGSPAVGREPAAATGGRPQIG
ncbi:MAG: DUF502 domain-containing protein [Phycisphaerales bacterium]